MLILIFLLNTLLASLALINFITIRRPRKVKQVDTSVVVFLPVRNEEENIERVITQLQNQQGVSSLTLIVINDNSTDRTREIAFQSAGNSIKVIDAPEPPAGWIGKVNALEHGFNAAPPADIYISIDADVHFEPDAIARAVALLEETGADFISPYPRQIAITWAERLVQPLLQWSWMSTVLLRGAEKIPLTSTVICNGQFLVMRASALQTIGGFKAAAHHVIDDIELGRALVRAGFRGAVVDGSLIASTRMYKSFTEIKSGYGKSLHAAFGSAFGALIAALFISATAILPFALALTGNALALSALALIILTRALSAASSGSRVRDSFLHPISAVLFIYLLYFSWRNRGKAQWKGRTL